GIHFDRVNNCYVANNYISNMQKGALHAEGSHFGIATNNTILSMGWAQGSETNHGNAASYFANAHDWVMDACTISHTRKQNCPDGGCFQIQNTKVWISLGIWQFPQNGFSGYSRSRCICSGIISCSRSSWLGSVVMARARNNVMVSASRHMIHVRRKLFKNSWLNPS